MLDLIHFDLCGPFSVYIPHIKLYFVVFLDDHTHLLNIQLLATKDQALDAWQIVKSLWENHAGHKVKVFCSDNGGEFISVEFTKALEEAGIEWQLAAPYAHQQNGKAEQVMHTLEGHSLAMLDCPLPSGVRLYSLPPTYGTTPSLLSCHPGRRLMRWSITRSQIYLIFASLDHGAGPAFPLNCKVNWAQNHAR